MLSYKMMVQSYAGGKSQQGCGELLCAQCCVYELFQPSRLKSARLRTKDCHPVGRNDGERPEEEPALQKGLVPVFRSVTGAMCAWHSCLVGFGGIYYCHICHSFGEEGLFYFVVCRL